VDRRVARWGLLTGLADLMTNDNTAFNLFATVVPALDEDRSLI